MSFILVIVVKTVSVIGVKLAKKIINKLEKEKKVTIKQIENIAKLKKERRFIKRIIESGIGIREKIILLDLIMVSPSNNMMKCSNNKMRSVQSAVK